MKTAVFVEPRQLAELFDRQRGPLRSSSSKSSRPLLLQQDNVGHQHVPHHSSHPVLKVMHQRMQDGTSRPGSRRDNFKLGLVVEGGGMRGVVTGAMLMGLQDMGLFSNVFDAVYGASAGAINATYYLTGEQQCGCSQASSLYLPGCSCCGSSKKPRGIFISHLG